MESIGITHGSTTGGLDGDLLAAFVAVAETGGFTAAAQYLHKTQSTISLRIRTLETRLDARLLHRTSRQLSLTADGRRFLVYARRLLQLQREAMSAVGPSAQPTTLRFGLPEDYAETWLPGMLRAFAASHPSVRPHIHCRMSTELVEQLEAGALDLVLTVRHSAASNAQRVATEPLVWAAHRDFELAPNQPVPLAIFPEQCIYRRRALEALTGIDRAWQIDYTSQSPTGLRVAVDQCRAVTITGRRTLPEAWRVLGEDTGLPPLPDAVLEIHRSPSVQHPAFDAFTTLVEQTLNEGITGSALPA
ncbi:LysR family transcriptional regulator [Salinisphaera hydrothermalis]|uniref:LysR family transcriptional regulator n=1 Tax=Salinisphaera hydrothermalis TaxID=563188 RepID=UPI00333E70C2